MVVHTWFNDIVEICHAHVCPNKWSFPTPHLRVQLAKYYFIVHLWQGNVVDLDLSARNCEITAILNHLKG